MSERPRVLFVCVHNAGRSQMAAGFLRELSGGTVEVRSAGSLPADRLNPAAVAAMAEVGIDLAGRRPQVLTADDVRDSDVVVTMGCGDACPFYPGKRYEDWEVDDPAGKDLEHVRPIRDDLRRRVLELIASLGGPSAPRIPPVVDAAWLAAHAPGGGTGPHVVLADVRWYLTDPDGSAAHAAYAEGHLPGAVYVDLDAWLAGPSSTEDGRHPLPAPAVFARGMGALGIGDSTTVVAYDDAGGVIAARLVWMLRALGREAALLDGGYFAPEVRAWAGGVTTDVVERAPETFTPRPWPTALLASLDDVAPGTRAGATRVVDARPAERFRGEGPDVDPRSGHVPGAASLPCRENVEPSGHLAPVETLRERFAAAGVTAAAVEAGDVVAMCGSGVTACHDLLAMEHAGLGRARLFPGSWSQYAETDLPLATGA